MINNLGYAINSLNKMEFALHNLYFFKKPTVSRYKKEYSKFLKKKFVTLKKAKFGVPQNKILQL